MPRPKSSIPRVTLHRPTGTARVKFTLPDGRRVYRSLGKYGSPEARKNYEALLAELSSGEIGQDSGEPRLTVAELAHRYITAAGQKVARGGLSPSTLERHLLTFRPLLDGYSETPVDGFKPRDLVAIRDRILNENGHQSAADPKTGERIWIPPARATVDARIAIIKRLFKWAAANALCSPETFAALTVIENLEPNATIAVEPREVKPATVDDLHRTITELDRSNPVVADMLRIQILTGMRSGELCSIRLSEIRTDFDDGVWEYYVRQENNKTKRYGKGRIVPIGPKAQAILCHYLNESDADDYLFSPRKSVAIQKHLEKERNPNPVRGSHKKRNDPPKRRPGAKYNKDSYRKAVQRAARRGGVTVDIFPHQFRHNAADEINKELGKEAARTVLGHSSTKTTDIYVDYNRPLAHRAAIERG